MVSSHQLFLKIASWSWSPSNPGRTPMGFSLVTCQDKRTQHRGRPRLPFASPSPCLPTISTCNWKIGRRGCSCTPFRHETPKPGPPVGQGGSGIHCLCPRGRDFNNQHGRDTSTRSVSASSRGQARQGKETLGFQPKGTDFISS